MTDTTVQLLYLEPDDEITSVVRRLRESDAARVVLVASGRSKVTSSSVGLRLLARVADEEGRAIAIVADPAARALATEAGIEAFASVTDASAEVPLPAEPQPVRRASIRVVRELPERLGDPMPLPQEPREAGGAGAPPGAETQTNLAVPAAAAAGGGSARGGVSGRRRTWLLLAVVLVALAALAAVLPGATVAIVPATSAIAPRTYTVEPPMQGPDTATLRSTLEGSATGERVESIPATGTVTFYNWNGPNTPVEVPAGTLVSGGGVTFRTDEVVVVPGGHFAGGPIESGEADAAVTAVDGGPDGNVRAGVIDTVETASVAAQLTGPFQILPLVTNGSPTSGGDEVRHTVIEQADVVAVVNALLDDLRGKVAARLSADPSRIYPSATFVPPQVDVPGDLVGTEDQETFELSVAYPFSRGYVLASDVETAAADAFTADPDAVPAGMSVVPDTLEVQLGSAREAGSVIVVEATVSARVTAEIDLDTVRGEVLGQTPDEARATLASLGTVRVELWPGWVDRIPRLEWRVSVEVVSE
jgi:hypothetical protein